MEKRGLPKNILVIQECTFILPDDFTGTVNDAFQDFLKYNIEQGTKDSKYYDELNLFSTTNVLLYQNPDKRVCGQYMLCQLVDGKYKLLDGTGSI